MNETGGEIRNFAAEEGYTGLSIIEPPFAGMLRALDGRGVIVHLDDSSRILGRVAHVSEDGMLVDLDNGPSFYTLDVSKIAVVETGGSVPRALSPATPRTEQESGR